MASSTNKLDMTKGSIIRLAVVFALPICAGNVLQQLYSTVDTLVIGNYCDAAALAAVATSAQPLEILLCIFLGIGTGVSILVSQAEGAGDMAGQQKLARTAVWFLYASSIPLTIVGLFVGPWLLRFMQVPADAWDGAVTYLAITTLGCIGNMGYNLNAGILRGMGNSNSSLLLLVVACVVNIVLDLVFVAGLGMGVAGAALATTAAMMLSWLFSIRYIKKNYPQLSLPALPHGFDAHALREIVRIGLPLGLNTALYSVGHLLLQRLFNAQGTVFVAGCAVAVKVNSLASIAITSFSSSATVFAGQNLGAGDYQRLRQGAVRIPLFSGAITMIAGVVVTIFCEPLLMLFTRDAAVLEMAVRYTSIVLPFMWAYAVLNGIMSFVNGVGEIRYPTIVNMIMLWVVRIPAAYALDSLGYGTYTMAAMPISFVVGMVAMLCYFRTHRWRDLCAKA